MVGLIITVLFVMVCIYCVRASRRYRVFTRLEYNHFARVYVKRWFHEFRNALYVVELNKEPDVFHKQVEEAQRLAQQRADVLNKLNKRRLG